MRRFARDGFRATSIAAIARDFDQDADGSELWFDIVQPELCCDQEHGQPQRDETAADLVDVDIGANEAKLLTEAELIGKPRAIVAAAVLVVPDAERT